MTIQKSTLHGTRAWPFSYKEFVKYCVCGFVASLILFFHGGGFCVAQGSDTRQTLLRQAQQEFAAGNFADAERDFRALTKVDPSDILAQTYLGHSQFREEKYADAVVSYNQARKLEASGGKLPLDQHRVLIDQLAMAYGISGHLKDARVLLQSAIVQDPEYPLNYYNLACAYAEDGDKNKMLANLSLAFTYKDHILKGEQMPDPRTDSSFQQYLRDPEFTALMVKLGYK